MTVVLKKKLTMKDRWNSRKRGFFYLLGISLGQDGARSLQGFNYLNTCWTSQSKCRSRVKWRHNETWTVYDCDLFVQGDNLHAPGTRKTVTDRALIFLKDKGENTKLRVGLNKLSTVCQIQFIIICFMFI